MDLSSLMERTWATSEVIAMYQKTIPDFTVGQIIDLLQEVTAGNTVPSSARRRTRNPTRVTPQASQPAESYPLQDGLTPPAPVKRRRGRPRKRPESQLGTECSTPPAASE